MTRVAKRDVLLRGTLDMLSLRTLRWGLTHGHDIAKHIQRTTDDGGRDGQDAQPRVQVLLPDGLRTAPVDRRRTTVAARVEGDRERHVAADGGMT
jgi:hypothetical protein